MRKVHALVVALVMILALAACDASSHRDIDQDATAFIGKVVAPTATAKANNTTAAKTTTSQSTAQPAAQATPAANTAGTAPTDTAPAGTAPTGAASGEPSGSSAEPPTAPGA